MLERQLNVKSEYEIDILKPVGKKLLLRDSIQAFMPRSLHARRVSSDSQERGVKTRQNLIETAGRVFADKGYHATTSREICDLAGVNTAAVNYYFGGIRPLYEAAVSEARREVVIPPEAFAAILEHQEPLDQLKAYYGLMARRLLSTAERSWQIRLVTREMVMPTISALIVDEDFMAPQLHWLRDLLARMLNRPPDHPDIGRAELALNAPFMVLATVERGVLEAIAPSLAEREREIEPMSRALETFALAGLQALARRCSSH